MLTLPDLMENFWSRRVRQGLVHRSLNTESERRDGQNCEPPDPANTVTDRLNNLLQNSGDGFVLSLCPNATYLIQAPIEFAHNNQEISTLGYPTDNSRAVLAVSGPVMDGQGHTTAIDGTCSTCSGVKLRNIQVDGARRGGAPTGGGGNIEMGGDNQNQLVEFVRSWDPRSWSCLHMAEGPFTCSGAIVQNNDIGPCGSDKFQEWADGISMSCRDSIVRNNMIQDPTDGGIVVFGAPGTQVYNNTIWILNARSHFSSLFVTTLGGINMVDYDPWGGNFTDTIVRDNVILGGYATTPETSDESKGNNFENAIIKIGIAVGPRTWFGDKYGDNVVQNGTIMNNRLSGAFSYGIAATSAANFTIQGNSMFGNTSFIGARGPLCEDSDIVPTPGPFVIDPSTTTDMSLQNDFVPTNQASAFTCVLPPNGGDFWPFGLNPSNTSSPLVTGGGSSTRPGTTPTSGSAAGTKSGTKSGSSTGVAVGVVVGVIVCALAAYIVRKRYLARREAQQLFHATKQPVYTPGI